MSTLTENVSLTIRVDTVGIARAGFGIPLIFTTAPTWTERTRTYESISDVAVDFAVGTATYLSAEALFSQEPHPEQVIVGRGVNKTTQQYTIGALNVANTTAYGLNLIQPGATVTNPVAYTSDGSATAQEIHNGLLTLLNAIAGKNYSATFAPLASLTPATFTADHTVPHFHQVAHGYNTGDGPIWFSEVGGALPAGGNILASTNYWIIKIDADNYLPATSLANALANSTTGATFSDNGSGTLTATPQASCVSPILPFLVTANSAGNWFSLEVTDLTLLTNKQTHADPGIATDLIAIQLQNDSWYALLTHSNSKALVLAAAAWIETQSKIYLADVVDTDAINIAIGSSPTDTLFSLNAFAYNRTAGAFFPSPGEMFSSAWGGRVLPDDPGSETWTDKQLVGIPVTNLNATHRTNLQARNANYYVSIGGVGATQGGGKIAGGTFGYIDVTRGLDWLENDMTVGVMNVLLSNEKVPYTNAGIAVIRNEVKASLKRAASMGIINDDFTITVPDISAVSSGDKALRQLTNVKFACSLQGAVQRVVISGVVSF